MMKNFLFDLINFMNDRTTLSSKELQNYINSTSVILLFNSLKNNLLSF